MREKFSNIIKISFDKLVFRKNSIDFCNLNHTTFQCIGVIVPTPAKPAYNYASFWIPKTL